MALNFPITFSLAPLPTGQALDGNEFGQALVANLQATISGEFLTGQIGGTQPTQDVGPWANNQHWYFWDAATSQYLPEAITSTIPVGAGMEFHGTVAPAGFVFQDGALYLRTGVMANLFAVIGTVYGAGDGFSTFAVPDRRGRTGVGAGTGVGLTPRARGSTFGEENHVLTGTELASHNHTITDPSHIHTASSTDSGHLHGITSPNHHHGISSVDPGHTHSISAVDPGHVHGNFLSDPGHGHVAASAESGHLHNISASDPGHGHGITDSHSHQYVQAATAGQVAQSGSSLGFVNIPTPSQTTGTNSGAISVVGSLTGIPNTGLASGTIVTSITPHTTGIGLGNVGATTGIANTGAQAIGIVNTADATALITATAGAAASITTTVATHSTGITATNLSGSNAGHNTIQPSLCCFYIIKF